MRFMGGSPISRKARNNNKHGTLEERSVMSKGNNSFLKFYWKWFSQLDTTYSRNRRATEGSVALIRGKVSWKLQDQRVV